MTTTTRITVEMSPGDLETLVRRAVRDEVYQLLRVPVSAFLDDRQVEEDDDALLLAEALQVLEQYRDNPDAWMKWEDFLVEIEAAEAAGELPD